TANADADVSYERTIGGKEVAAKLSLHVEPCETGKGNVYTCGVKRDASVPDEIYDAVEQSINNCFAGGIKFGYPCADVSVTLTALNFDPLTGTTFAYEAAAAQAFDEACTKANPEMLEPVMEVDIESPSEFTGEAMSAITQRGGMISSMEDKAGGSIIHAQAPMVKMFGFSTNLRSVTQGRASFGMTFSHFQIKA
ncbi:MAG: elongation factor G, partial [Treponema sp.]|nr:elongation factor G [Treponema sp.]